MLAKMMNNGPVLIHTVTKKGKGYRNAEINPEKYHGIAPFEPTTGKPVNNVESLTYSQVFGNKLANLAADNSKIVAISAAMIESTGLVRFQEKFPDRVFDVGIAEQHAVTFAALNGYRPVVAIYSTFLQRSYDQLIEDICLEKLPVLFMIDRAGNVGSDGETHHGIFDLSYLSHMPGMTVMAPKDGAELAVMLEYALATIDGPCAIRYPRGAVSDLSSYGSGYSIDGSSEIIAEGKDVTIAAIGKMVEAAVKARETLRLYGYDAEIINARFLKPLDNDTILKSVCKTGNLVTLEDNVTAGGFGSTVLNMLSSNKIWGIKTLCLGWPDKFIEQGSMPELFAQYGLDSDSIAERVRDFIEGKA